MMIGEATVFLLDALLLPFVAVLLFRFHAVWLNVPMRNPIGEFIMAITDFLVLRTRRYVPPIAGLDTATLLLALLCELLYLVATQWAHGYQFHSFPLPGLLLLALVKLFKISLYLLIIAVFAQAILSWVNPHSTASPLLNGITRRFLQPLRRVVPLLGRVDLTPLLLFIICQLIIIVPIGMLEQFAIALF